MILFLEESAQNLTSAELLHAARLNDKITLRHALEYRRDLLETTFNEHGQTLVHVLAIHGYKSMLPQLVEVIDINRKDLVKKKKRKESRGLFLLRKSSSSWGNPKIKKN